MYKCWGPRLNNPKTSTAAGIIEGARSERVAGKQADRF